MSFAAAAQKIRWQEEGPPSLDEVQAEMINAVFREKENGVVSTVLEAATGVGKTHTAAKIVHRYLDEFGGPVLFLAHTGELVKQAADEFAAMRLDVAIEMRERFASTAAIRHGEFGGVDVVVCSKDSLHTRRILHYPRDTFKLIITDECNLAPEKNKSFKHIYDYFDWEFHLGLSATPFRMDGAPIHSQPGATFQTRAYRYPLVTAIKNGHLCEVRAIVDETSIDLRGLKTVKGDFNVAALEDRIIPQIEVLCNRARQNMDRYGIDQAICFTPDVKSAIMAADVFTQIGVPAAAVHGDSKDHKMPDRTRVNRITAFKRGDIRVLVNCNILCFGFNHPPTGAVIMMRPTKSLPLALQQVGRGTRRAKGKRYCYVLGYSWEGNDGVMASTDILLTEEEDIQVRERARQLARKKKGEQNPLELIEEARQEIADEQAWAEHRAKINAHKREIQCKSHVFNPFGTAKALGIDIGERDVSGASGSPINPKTAAFLQSVGLQDVTGLSETQGKALANRLLDNAFENRVSIKQAEWATKHAGLDMQTALALDVNDFGRLFARITGKRRH